jgi:putative Mg2+ transporter-C (MgtC) family protein
MAITLDDVLRLLLSIVLGGLVGAEREVRDKSAGFRTMIFICAGAALFTIVGEKVGGSDNATRIIANIVTGVGFLGAGVIMRDGGRVTGLTTAAMIWLTAALGMGVGSGYYVFSTVATAIMLVVMWFFPRIEAWLDNRQDRRTYELVFAIDLDKPERLEATFQQCGLQARRHAQTKQGKHMSCAWIINGSPDEHERLIKLLLTDAEILELRY